MLLAVSFMTTPALAGGFYAADVGARGMARGGAFVAAPDDVIAMHYNPAGLSLLKGFHLQADVQLVDYSMTFARTCPCTPEGVNPERDAELEAIFAENPAKTDTLLAIPFLGLAYGLDFLDLTLAVGIWGPTSGRHDYGDLPEATAPSFPTRALDQPNRYSGITMNTLEANIAFALALSPFEGFRLGATAILFQNGNDQTLHLWANILGEAEDPNYDVPIVFSFKENTALNWQVGASYDIPYVPGRLSLGAAFRGKRDIRTGGTIDVTLPTELEAAASVTGDKVTVELSTAPIFRGGIQYMIEKLFRAEVAFVWEGWSAHDDIVIRPQNIEFEITIPEPTTVALDQIVASRRWKDTWSIRAGGEINLLEPYLGIRAGYFYEPSAIPVTRLDPSRVDLDKHGVGIGLSTTWFGATVELSGMYIALKSTEITNSEVKLISPLPTGDPDKVTTIGNGKYSGQYFIFGASLRFALDPLLEEL